MWQSTLSLFRICSYLGLFALCLSSCSSVKEPSSADTEKTVDASIEFIYNYDLLSSYYLYQGEELDSMEAYIDKVAPFTYSQYEIPLEYYDIYYMYMNMSDDYTYYIDPSSAAGVYISYWTSEQLMDAGFEWTKEDSTSLFVVKNVVKNSPADKAGIKVNDIILSVEGVAPTSEVALERLTRGSEGDTVSCTIQRDSTTFDATIVLAPYYSPTVELSFKDSIPIIKISSFDALTSNDSGTYGEFVAFMRETEEYKSLIVDVRDNGGGNGEQCFSIAQEFLSKGDSTVGTIYAYKDSVRMVQVFDTLFDTNGRDGIVKDRYVVFLANGNTASCSEVLLASVVMNKKFPLVGTTTYGKGIGQRFFITPSYGFSRITNSKVLDKDHKTYHAYGIEPDFYITDDSLALDKAVELAKERSFVRTAGYGSANTGHFSKRAVIQDTMPPFYIMPRELRKNFLLNQ